MGYRAQYELWDMNRRRQRLIHPASVQWTEAGAEVS